VITSGVRTLAQACASSPDGPSVGSYGVVVWAATFPAASYAPYASEHGTASASVAIPRTFAADRGGRRRRGDRGGDPGVLRGLTRSRSRLRLRDRTNTRGSPTRASPPPLREPPFSSRHPDDTRTPSLELVQRFSRTNSKLMRHLGSGVLADRAVPAWERYGVRVFNRSAK
jgi:hypothetical protein